MTFKKFIDKIERRISLTINNRIVNKSLERQAEADALKLIYEKSSRNTVIYDNKQKLRDAVFEKKLKTGEIFEFGVFKGLTANLFAKALLNESDNRKLFGFDSFKGFSEDWNGIEKIMPSSKFDRGGCIQRFPVMSY